MPHLSSGHAHLQWLGITIPQRAAILPRLPEGAEKPPRKVPGWTRPAALAPGFTRMSMRSCFFVPHPPAHEPLVPSIANAEGPAAQVEVTTGRAEVENRGDSICLHLTQHGPDPPWVPRAVGAC